MNVLIVDDDRFVVAALKKGIHWDSLGFTEIYTAYSFEQARGIISSSTVDLLISDIDMPHGSGLDLLSWMRGKRNDTPCIFLTNYADFTYAQQAIDLKCFHYFLKPVDYIHLTKVIKKAVAEVSSHYSQISEKYLSFWRNVLLSKRLPEDGSLPYEGDILLTPVCIQFYPYYLTSDLTLKSHLKEDFVALTRPFLEAHVPSMANAGSILTAGIPGSDRCYLILEDAPEASALQRQLEEFLSVFMEKTHCPANLYQGDCVPVREILEMVGKIHICLRNDLGETGHVKVCVSSLHVGHRTKGQPYSISSGTSSDLPPVRSSGVPNTPSVSTTGNEVKKIASFLSEERFDLLSDYCHSFLEHLQAAGSLNAASMRSFQIDVVQQLYTYLGKRGILAKRLFYGEPYHTIAACAERCAKDLEMYFHYVFSIAERSLDATSSEKGVADIIRDFVDEHFAEDIGRESLSDILYFDPDYASRLFKKETGISFMNYVIQKRLTESKRLLRSTEYPISKIAAEVGYDNYSYFTRLFKKECGVTPVEYRMHLL